MTFETEYCKTRRGIGTEKEWRVKDWLLVDIGSDDQIVGFEVFGDHTVEEALWAIMAEAHAPPGKAKWLHEGGVSG